MGSENKTGGRVFPHKIEIMSPQAVDKMVDVILGYLEDTGIKFDKHEQHTTFYQKQDAVCLRMVL